MEVGRISEALAYVNKSLEIDPSVKNTWGYAGLLYQTLGQSQKAIYYLRKTLDLDPMDHTGNLLIAMCYQAELKFNEAFKYFDKLLSFQGDAKAEVHVQFHRELAFVRRLYLDVPFSQFNFNLVFDSRLKVGLHKRFEREFILPSDYNRTIGVLARQYANQDAEMRVEKLIPSLKAKEALAITSHLRYWIQLDSPGFLPHRRQHRMFGLAVLEMVQSLREHVSLLKKGEPGLWIPDVVSSSPQSARGASRPRSFKAGHHIFSWRDFFDIAVKWRQLAEPFDVVFWLDTYPPHTSIDMVALSTSLFSGLKRNSRYYSYFNFTYEVARNVMKKQYYTSLDPTFTSSKQLPEIEKAQTLDDLFQIAKVSSVFFVVTECESSMHPGKTIPGTRIIVSKVPPEGYDLSIGSPTHDKRFEFFEAEVNFVFSKIVAALVKNEPIENLALDLFFYWANWGPLSRGTAATGYMSLLACFLASGESLTSKIPKLKQMDWEAILRTNPSEFRKAVKTWVGGRSKSAISTNWLDANPGFKLSEIFKTSRDVIQTLSALDDDDMYS
jgi:hypothetical protein